mgnify:CR=1 FL=1
MSMSHLSEPYHSRLYDVVLHEHLRENRQMAFMVGPRQVGKTTLSRGGAEPRATTYLNWDNVSHRRTILAGPEGVAQLAGLARLTDQLPVIAFDEIHKYKGWKDFLKGFFDTYGSYERAHSAPTRPDVRTAGACEGTSPSGSS